MVKMVGDKVKLIKEEGIAVHLNSLTKIVIEKGTIGIVTKVDLASSLISYVVDFKIAKGIYIKIKLAYTMVELYKAKVYD